MIRCALPRRYSARCDFYTAREPHVRLLDFMADDHPCALCGLTRACSRWRRVISSRRSDLMRCSWIRDDFLAVLEWENDGANLVGGAAAFAVYGACRIFL